VFTSEHQFLTRIYSQKNNVVFGNSLTADIALGDEVRKGHACTCCGQPAQLWHCYKLSYDGFIDALYAVDIVCPLALIIIRHLHDTGL